MQVNISGEQERWLSEAAAISGRSAEALLKSILGSYIKNNPLEVKEKAKDPDWLPSQGEIVSDAIINYFKEIYKRKFEIDSDEKFDKKLVATVFDKINASVEDYKTVLNILQKAIVWYIYQHDNTSKEGNQFPYLLRILFEQDWLLKSCIEASRSTNLELLLKAQEKNMTTKELSRAIRRGDVTGAETGDNIPALLEDALIKVELFVKKFDLDGRLLKKSPKLKELYTSELPSAAYIRKALQYLEKSEKDAE